MLNPKLGSEKSVDCRLCKCPHYFVYCGDCKEFVLMGNNRIQYCRKCKVANSPDHPHSVLCCVECENPLRVTDGGGSYCEYCDFHPMMSDTFLLSSFNSKSPT